MSYEIVKDFEYRGFKCEITKITPEEIGESLYHDFCVVEFVKPTTLDKILFFAIGEGVRSDAVAALIDFVGLTAFYPGDFNKDIDLVMKIGLVKHEEHIACYTSDHEGDHWKYMTPSEMEAMLKHDIDNYHEARKRFIEARKMYLTLAEKMQEAMQQIQSGVVQIPKA